MIALTHAFGLSQEPFAQDIPVEQLYQLPGLKSFHRRFEYALELPAVTVITGDVGSGKSTSLRAATAPLHPTQYVVLSIVATTGGMLELLRQICLEFGAPPPSNSTAKLMRTIRELLCSIAEMRQVAVLLIDEAHCLQPELLEGLRLLSNLETEKRKLLSLLLVGQNELEQTLKMPSMRALRQRISVWRILVLNWMIFNIPLEKDMGV